MLNSLSSLKEGSRRLLSPRCPLMLWKAAKHCNVFQIGLPDQSLMSCTRSEGSPRAMVEAFCCMQAGNTDCYKDANGYWIHNSGHYYWAADHSAAGGSWQPCQSAVSRLWAASRMDTGQYTLR